MLKLITKNDEAESDELYAPVGGIKEKIDESVPIQVDINVALKDIPRVKENSDFGEDLSVSEKSKMPHSEEKKTKDEATVSGRPTVDVKIEKPTQMGDDPLINLAEVLAKEKMALVMERMKVCMCPICVNDVLALTLNSLPTKYVTTDAGKQFFQLDGYKKQYEREILAALTKACVRVKASPRHGK